MKQTWVCTHRQTKKRLILAENDAFDLDKRQWSLKLWTCTAGHERPALSKETKVGKVREFTMVGMKCEECGAYHTITDRCHRLHHVRYWDLFKERR